MEKREKKFLIAGIIFSVIMIVFSYVAITSDNGEKAEISKGRSDPAFFTFIAYL